jgi:fucose permease
MISQYRSNRFYAWKYHINRFRQAQWRRGVQLTRNIASLHLLYSTLEGFLVYCSVICKMSKISVVSDGIQAHDQDSEDKIELPNISFFGSYTVHYRIYIDRPTNALSCMFLYFSQWLLHVSARQCHRQGATGFLLSYFRVQCVRRQVTESMV